LHGGFDVDTDPLLERNDSLRIPPRPLAAVTAEDDGPLQQVDRVNEEAEREFSSHRGHQGA